MLAAVRDLDRHVIIVNDRLNPVRGHIVCRDVETGRILLKRDFEVGANAVLDVDELDFVGLAAKGVIAIDGTAAGINLRNHYLYGEQPFDLSKVREWLKGRPIYDRE